MQKQLDPVYAFALKFNRSDEKMLEEQLRQYDHHAGHIHIASCAMPIVEIDWAMLACSPSETFEDFLTPHFLHGIEARGKFSTNLHDYYLMQGNLKLHTDENLLRPRHMRPYVMGMILECDDDLFLTTGQEKVSVKAGDIYFLDPLMQHGTETEGFLAFAASDYPLHSMPAVAEFRQSVLTELESLITGAGAFSKKVDFADLD